MFDLEYYKTINKSLNNQLADIVSFRKAIKLSGKAGIKKTDEDHIISQYLKEGTMDRFTDEFKNTHIRK